MNLTQRIKSFSALGSILIDALNGRSTQYTLQLNHLIETQHLKNPWFTYENVRMAVSAIAVELTTEKLKKWTDFYPDLKKEYPPLRVAVIMAGNIPLVGFHDFLTVLITGNNILAKTSSKDSDLIKFIGNILYDIDPEYRKKIDFSDSTISGFDIVIATGSDNTSRYFENYFGKYPSIIRKNRNSIAVLEGNETDEELEALGTDVFSYFGLGCRNVSKLYVPEGYDFSRLIHKWEKYSDLINHQKYANNYDFNKAVFLVNRESFTDTGFVLIKEERGLASPVAVLWFEHFRSPDRLKEITENLNERIQCIVGKNHLSFGSAQSPVLWDYADGTDTVEFLLKKNIAGIS
jgi:hypothetical protein